MAIVTQIWEAQTAGREAFVSSSLQRSASGVVHGEHDIKLHRPIVPGEPLRTWVAGFGSRPAGRNALITLHHSTYDEADLLVAEQWWTMVYLNTTCSPAGQSPPSHAIPDHARRNPRESYRLRIDSDMARRYAEVSGDWSAHHFDVSAARSSGFERPFLHGLCTMALCAQGVDSLVGSREPTEIGRIAVRFAAPAYIGEELTVDIYELGRKELAFEAVCANVPVVTHGLAERG